MARKEPTAEEVAAAGTRLGEIRDRLRKGDSVSATAKALHLNTRACELALAEASFPATPSPTIPPGAMTERPSPTPPPAEPLDLAEAVGAGRQAGALTAGLKTIQETASARLLERFYTAQIEAVELANLKAKRELEGVSHGDGKPTESAGFLDQFSKDEERELQREYVRARISSLRRGEGAPGGEVETLRVKLSALEAERRDRAVFDAVHAGIGPVVERIKKLEEQQPKRLTYEDVELDRERRSVARVDAAQTEVLGALSEKIRASGSLQALAKTVLHASAPELQTAAIDWIRGIHTPQPAGNGEGGIPPPTPGGADVMAGFEAVSRFRMPRVV